MSGHGKRRLILEEERKGLREHHRNTIPTPSYQDLIEWFTKQYDGYVIGHSTVGRCLSIEFDYLDTPVMPRIVKFEQDENLDWTHLEEVLRKFMQRWLEAKGRPNSLGYKSQYTY